MSAELITFICKGPEHLPESKRAWAVHLVGEKVALAKRLLAEDGDLGAACYAEGWDVEDLEYLAACDPTQVIDALFRAWREECGDVNARFDPDDSSKKIVVAGEMSWGDTPGGDGYQAFATAVKFRLFDVFGIY